MLSITRPVADAAPAPRIRPLRSVILFAILIATIIVPAQTAQAAGNRTFSNTYAATIHGDIAEIGNANSTCNPSWTPSPACDTNSTSLSNSTKGYGVLVDTDGDPSTTNSSASTVAIPAGATIEYARLTWGATGDDTDNNGEAAVKFDTPAEAGINYRNVSADYATRCGGFNAAAANRGFACSADVTSLVQAAGSGRYTVGAIEQRPVGNGSADSVDHWSGWALYIVYDKPGDQLRRIVLSDGFLRVADGVTASPITINGFTAPATGTVKARLVYAAGEGDAGITGDNATLNSTTLDPAATPDLMNSSNSGHTYQTSRSPTYANQYGFDVDSQVVNGAIANGATSATFTFTTNGDTYYPFSLGVAVDLDEPKVVLTKSLTDLNGGVVESGDVLEYTVLAKNAGNDGATDVVMTDNIPTNTTYVPGSMVVSAGANAGTKTDAAADDQATFDGGAKKVTMNLGAGATASSGGSLAINAETTVKFRVTVDAGIDDGVPVTNTANGAYKGQTALFSYANPSTIASTPIRRSDLTVTVDPGTLVAGRSSDVTITANNIGGAGTRSQPVTLTTTVPADVTFGAITTATGWTCSTASLPTITCTRSDTLAASSSYPVVKYSVTPSQTAPNATFTASVAGGNELKTDNDSDSKAASITRSADLSLTNIGDVATANVGQTITYTINGRNLGPSTTTGVAVTGTLPSGLQPSSATLGGSPCSISGQVITCSTGALGASGAPADTATIVVKAVVLASAAGTTRTFTPSIAGTDPDPVSGNNSAAVSVAVNPAADVALTQTRTPASVNPGSDVTFTFTATNNGPTTAAGVELVDTLPSGVTVQSITPSQGTCGTGTTFTCTLGSIANGATATVTVVVRPQLSTANSTLTNSGTVSATTFDQVAGNNAATASVTVNPAADLRTTVISGPSAVNVGADIDYLVTIHNDGPQTATGATVAVDLPEGATVVQITPSAGVTCPSTGDPRTCTVGSIVGGGSATVTVRMRATNANAGTGATLSATAAATTYDPTASNNTASATSTVNASADIELTETRTPATVDPGSNVTFTFSLKNNGPSTATGVVLTDTLPSGAVVQSITPSKGTCGTGSPFTCTIGSMANGTTETVVVVVKPALSTAGTTLTNPGSVTSTSYDAVSSNDSATASVAVNPAADLRTTVAVSPAAPTVGDTVDYTFTVTNDGPSPATAAQLRLNLPTGATVVSITPSAGTCPATGNPRDCAIGSLAQGASATVVVRLTPTGASAGSNLNVVGTASGAQYDPSTANNAATGTAAVGAAADLRLTETVSPSPANVGSDVTYTFTVKNNGPGSATGVLLTDDLPAGAVVQSITTSKGTCGSGDPFSCTLGTLTSGQTETVTVVVRPATSTAGSTLANPGVLTSSSYDPNTGDNSASATLTVNPAADLQTSVTVDQPTSDVGEIRTYVVTVKNNGPSAATGVSSAIDLPNGATVVSITPSQGTCPATGDPRTCTIGNLASGDSATVEVKMRLTAANASGAVTLAATSSATQYDPTAGNNGASASTTAGNASDLQLTQTAAPNPANPGSDVTYTLTVRNNGPDAATGVVVTDDLPDGVTVVSITPSQGSCGTGDPFTCPIGSLASGASATVTVVVRPGVASAGQSLANAGNVASTTVDPDPSNNAAGATASVNPAADLRTTATVDSGAATVGSTRTYLLTVTNDGPSAASGATLAVSLPAGATVLSITPSQGSCPSSGSPRTCALGSIGSGGSATVSVDVRVENANAGSSVTVGGTAAANEFDQTAGNNTASVSSSVGSAADLRITKTADKTSANVGDTITWTIRARNFGPDTALGTTVTDAIPAGVTITSATSTVGSCATGSSVSCTVGSLANGAEAVITVVGRVERAAAGSPVGGQASVTGTVFDLDTSNNVSSAPSTAVGPAADLRVVTLVDNPNPRAGQTVTWTIQVFNDGPSPATNVHLTDVVPAGAPITSVSTTAGTCARTGQSVDCAVGDVPAGGSQTVTIVAQIPSNSAGGAIDNTATATSSTGDPDASNNTSTAGGTAAGAADLSITLTPDRDTATVGQRITWTGVVGNAGPQTATGVVVTLQLPEGMSDVTASTPGGTCVVSGRTVTCKVKDVAAATSGGLTISGIVTRGAAEKTLAISGTAAANETDPSPVDNTASGRGIAIAPAVDLRLEKTADRAEVAVGDTLTVTSAISNRGPSTATDVIVVDDLPEGVELLSVTPSQGSCTVEGRRITCNLGVLTDGQAASIKTAIVVRAAGAGQRLLSGGSVTSAQFDTNDVDNSASVDAVGVKVGDAPVVSGAPAPAPFIDLTKTVDNASPAGGDTVVYTITAANKGNAPATAVRVVDALPTGLTYRSTKVSGGVCSRAARTVTCVAATLEAGKSMVVKISAEVTEPGKAIQNTATVTAAGLPSTSAQGQRAGVSIKATGGPFVFAAIKPATVARAGKTVRIAVKVTNTGLGTARDAQACFKLPASVVLVRKPAGLVQKGTQFCLNAAALAAGKNKRVVLQARVVGAVGNTMRPTITAKASNAKARARAYAIQVRGTTVASRGNGVTG